MEGKHIVYDLISWIHPQRFTLPETFSSTRCKSIINDMLLYSYNLSVGEIDYCNCTERYLANYWLYLPKAAFMVACQRHRASLAYSGILAELDQVTRQFSLANLCISQGTNQVRITFDFLWTLALNEINFFAKNLSTIMKERMPLLFPVSKLPNENIGNTFLDNELLIRLAIQHASRS